MTTHQASTPHPPGGEHSTRGRRFGPIRAVLVSAGLAVAGCGGDDSTPDEAETSSEEATTTGATVALDATFDLTFDGSECVAEGPAEVPPGEVTVLLVNESDNLASAVVRRLEDGYTYEDMVDVGEGEGLPSRPSWVREVPQLDSSVPEGTELPLGDTYTTWLVGVDSEPGQHDIHLWNADDLWPCAGFVVTGE